MWLLKILVVFVLNLLASSLPLVSDADDPSGGNRSNGVDNTQLCIIFGSISLIILAIICVICLFRLMHRADSENDSTKKIFRREGNVKNIDRDQTLYTQVDLLPYDRTFEISRRRVQLRRRIGVSTFGTIYKASVQGICSDKERTIAVAKVIKKYDNIEIKRIFALELKVMVNLGQHLNIVNLLGAITKNARKHELTAIVEYCPYGNMQSFLVQHRPYFIDQIVRGQDMIDPTITVPQQRSEYTNTLTRNNTLDRDQHTTMFNFENSSVGDLFGGQMQPNISQNNVSSPNSFDYPTQPRNITRTVTTTDLLCWSFQIARGMQFLTSRNVLHGNLTAQNILLCDNNVVKITDFGLDRAVHKSNVYLDKRQDPMLSKWFAPECLAYKEFTSSSDVWSFGIVLWELFSLGAAPYPGEDDYISLQSKIQNGFRLDKPLFATEAIYQDVMSSCWRLNPELRPCFIDLEDGIYKLLERSIANRYIILNEPYVKWNAQHFSPAQTDYLKLVKSPEIPKSCKNDREQLNTAMETTGYPQYVPMNVTSAKDPGGYVKLGDFIRNA